MSSTVDKIISRAIEDGHFNDLPGEGQPLSLPENPHEDPAQRAAYRLLREHGFALPWIEMGKQIDIALIAATTQLRQRLEWYQRQGLRLDRSAGRDAAIEEFHSKVSDINEQINQHNLAVPLARFQRRRIDAEAEIRRLCS